MHGSIEHPEPEAPMAGTDKDSPARLMTRCLRFIRKERPALAQGMAWVVQTTVESEGDHWTHAAAHDWSQAAVSYVDWFSELLQTEALPGETEALWFEIPDDLNPASSIVLAFDELGPPQSDYGLDGEPVWPDRRCIAQLRTLESVIAASGWREADPERREELQPGVWALSASFIALAAMEAVEASGIVRSVHHRSGIALLTGFASGEAIPLLQRRPRGWGSVRRVKVRSKAAWEEIMWYPGLDIAGYLRAGCDPNARSEDRPHETLMMRHAMFLTPEQVDLLIAAGADIRARDDDGLGVLHRSSTAPLETVERLIYHGADVNTQADWGDSVLHAYVGSGPDFIRLLLDHGADATATHGQPTWSNPLDRAADSLVDPEVVTLLVEAGDRFEHATKEGNTPLHHLASSSIFEEQHRRNAPRLIALYKDMGFDINQRNNDGDTALWIALRRHASELKDHIEHVREHGDLGGSWDYNHDRMAIELLKQGADPNARRGKEATPFVPDGATPTMVQRYDDESLINALLDHGADTTLVDSAGRTALDHARSALHDGIPFGREGTPAVIDRLAGAPRR